MKIINILNEQDLNEIELISLNPNSFSTNHIKNLLSMSTPSGNLENYIVNYLENADARCIILTENNTGDIAAFAAFQVRSNGRVWQGRNALVYPKYRGQKLTGKIYKYIKDQYNKSIQSDTEQTIDGQKLWTKTLPSLGLKPMIYDIETGHVIDPSTTNITMYYTSNSNDPLKNRYTWIIEKNEHYRTRDMISENIIIMPNRHLWYDGGITQLEKDFLNDLASNQFGTSPITK